MMKEKSKYRSAEKHVRSNYLFLGLYIFAKFDLRGRLEADTEKHFMAFERMRDYFYKKFEEYSGVIPEIKASPLPFKNALQYFCDSYAVQLGSEVPTDTPSWHDWISYSIMKKKYKGDPDLMKEYYNKCLDFIKRHPNPLQDHGFRDFIQLMQINYTLTQDPEGNLRKMLGKIGREVFIRHISWRKDSALGNQQLKWPNPQIYQDQEAFIHTIKNEGLSYKELESLHIERKFGDIGYDEDRDNAASWYKMFIYDIFPMYYWFFILLLDKANWNESDKLLIKFWFYYINRSLYDAVNVFGDMYEVPKYRLDDQISDSHLDYNEEMDDNKPINWGKIPTIQGLPF